MTAEEILAAIESHLSTGIGCKCGWRCDTAQKPFDPRRQHRAHVAQQIAALLPEASEVERLTSALEQARTQADEDTLARWTLRRRAMKAEAALADLRARVGALADEWDRGGINYRPTAADALRALLGEA